MISMLSVGILEGLGNIAEVLFDVLGAILKGILAAPMFMIYVGVMVIAYFAEIVFKKLAGIDPIYLNGEQLTGASGDGKDLVYGFITDTAVQNVFWSIVALSIVLLFVCTLIALIKSEFTIDLKGSAKGPIIGRAFKSLVNFITVPVITIVAILGTNFLTKSIYDMFGGEDSTIVTKCFYVGAYNANRARINTVFATDLHNNAYSSIDSGDNQVFNNGTSPFEGKSQKEIADLIDQYFLEGKEITLEYNKVNFFSEAYEGHLCTTFEEAAGVLIGDAIGQIYEYGYVNWSLILFGYPSSDGDINLIDLREVNFFYDLSEFDFILSVGSAVVMSWLLLSVGVVLLKRVFELTILFLLAPAMTAIAPLDGGQSEKKWRGEFMKRLLAVIGPIFAYNMYFLMVPLFENIELFGSLSEVGGYASDALGAVSATTSSSGSMLGAVVAGIALVFVAFFVVFDIFFQLVCIFVGLSIVKSASALLSSLLGIEDLVKSGAENTKKAVDLGKKAALGATAMTGMAVRGVAATAKVVKGVGKGIANRFTEGGKSARAAKKQLKGAEEAEKQAADDVAEKDKALASAQEQVQSTDAYKQNEETITNLQKKKSEMGALIGDDYEALNKALIKRKILNGEKLSADEEKDKHKLISELKSSDPKLRSQDIYGVGLAKRDRDAAEEDRSAAATKVELLKRGIRSEDHGDFLDKAGNIIKESDLDENKKEDKEKLDFLEQASKGGILGHTKAAISSEFGKDSQKTSAIGSLFSSDGYEKFEKIASKIAPTALPALKQWLNPDNSETNTIKRRLNDALGGMFGENGGKDLWSIWFNKNARAGLYEGVPESKKRTSQIEQSLSWGARDKWQKDEDAKKARNEQEKLIRRMLATQKGGAFTAEYERLYNQREKETNQAQIEKLDAEIKKMEVNSGIAQQARDFYDQATPGSAKAKQLAEFKEMINDKAMKDAAASEQKSKEKAFKATVATSDKPLDTKIKDMDPNKMAEALKKAQGGQKSGMAELVELLTSTAGGTAGSTNAKIDSLVIALEKLVQQMQKNP